MEQENENTIEGEVKTAEEHQDQDEGEVKAADEARDKTEEVVSNRRSNRLKPKCTSEMASNRLITECTHQKENFKSGFVESFKA